MFACSYFVELLVKVFATVRYTLEKSEGGFAIFIIIIPEPYGFNNYPLKLITYEYTPRIQLFSYKKRLSMEIILVDMLSEMCHTIFRSDLTPEKFLEHSAAGGVKVLENSINSAPTFLANSMKPMTNGKYNYKTQ